MACPRVGDEIPLKRVIKYLRHRPRCVLKYDWQAPTEEITVYVDSDWANEETTRRSTSGGAMMCGSHLIHHWSRTQATVALSSGEAELNAAVKGISEGLQMKTLGKMSGRLSVSNC